MSPGRRDGRVWLVVAEDWTVATRAVVLEGVQAVTVTEYRKDRAAGWIEVQGVATGDEHQVVIRRA